MRRLGSGILMASIAFAAAHAAAPPTRCIDSGECMESAMKASIDAARHGRYMQASFGLLADLGVEKPDQVPDPDVFDQYSQIWSAMSGEPFPNGDKKPYNHIDAADFAALEAAQARPAIAEIVARARRTRIVYLDEDHLSPRGRLFGLQVARALRPLGYSVLAAEALTRDKDDAASLAKMQQLAHDGYVRRGNGYYLDDPVFADFLRQSLRLGYRLVSYESAGFTEESDDAARSARREQEQAENIVRRALERYPDAKVLVYGGRHHAAKAPIDDPNVKERLWMAERLKRLSGVDPLVIDQVELGAMPGDRPDANLYPIAAKKAGKQSAVLFKGSQPLVIGLLRGGVDLQVVHPPSERDAGRPAWLAQLGRSPAAIPKELLPASGTRLVQAFLADEAEDAIPIDQVLVRAGREPPKLMLPKARVRYAVQDEPGAEARATR